MLTLTDAAAEAIRGLVTGTALEPGGGRRISFAAPAAAATPLQAQIASGPQPGDRTIEEAGATVFLEAQAAELLDDKALDAAIDAGQVRFTVRGSND